MIAELSRAAACRGVAVLLHPHPDFGGNRFHPFVDGLFRRLPEIGITAVRFDFTSSDPSSAHAEAVSALDSGLEGLSTPGVLVGYSFGAGIAASLDDRRVAAWYLLAPQTSFLSSSALADDPRPKAIVVPQNDQFSPPSSVEPLVAGWQSCQLSVISDTDHFLGAIGPVVEAAVAWIDHVVAN